MLLESMGNFSFWTAMDFFVVSPSSLRILPSYAGHYFYFHMSGIIFWIFSKK